MGHVVRDTDWCVIDIDTTEGRIFFQERWRYNWLVQPPLLPWSYVEKKAFHDAADRAIWAAWSNRVRFDVTGTSAFARCFRAAGVPINLDIKWVRSNQHWTVNVTKIPADQFAQSNVEWTARVINLDSNDVKARTSGQVPVAHEFGHAAGNTAVLHRGDEYKASSAHTADANSIMNTGMRLRTRHFRTIIEELNKMIPNTRFSVRHV